MTEIEKMPPAADMRYEDEDPDAVARVFVRVEWKDGKIREYEALEPQAFMMNDPENEMPRLAPMRMAVQSGGSPVVPMMAAVPELRLSFTAHPRHNMVIRTERTAEPAQPREENTPNTVTGTIETPKRLPTPLEDEEA